MLKDFQTFLKEDLIQEGVKEHPHVEDLPNIHGNEGVGHAATVLNDIHVQLSGKTKEKFNAPKAKSKVHEKFDGVPIVFGKHPRTKKFFVAHDPKLPNFSHTDIKGNHGEDFSLATKLHHALEHLPKVTPKKGVFQGDLLYDKDHLGGSSKHHEFTPNAITYKVDKNSEDGKKISRAHIGLTVHTKFDNKSAPVKGFDPHKEFIPHEDVHVVHHQVPMNPEVYTAKHRSEFTNHIQNASLKYAKMKPEALEDIKNHAPHIDNYINHTIRGNKTPDVKDYISHLGNQGQKEGMKGDKAKAYQKYANLAQDAQTKQSHLKLNFEMHRDLQKAKNTLIDALSTNRPGWSYAINKKKIGPVGYTVHHDDGDPVKLENRKTAEKINTEMKRYGRK
jgi:hypothetical protein